MIADRILPLFVGFFGVMAVGVLLRYALRGPVNAATIAPALTLVIVDVTAPALTLDVLLRTRIPASLLVTLVPATAALVAMLALTLAAGRAAKLPRAQLGAVAMTGSFSNTGFVGIPLIQGLFADDARGAQAAVVIDACDTTLLLWTLGLAVASRFGDAAGARAGLGGLLRKPITWAVLWGFALNAAGVTLPPWLRPGVERLGAATGPLVFLTLGLAVDVAKLRGRAAVIAATVFGRLALSPVVALGVALAMGLRGPVAIAAVLQAAMPSALVSVVIATQQGCDGTLASAIATASMLLAPLTLPLWIAVTSSLLA